jgi:hypothetical protein
MARTNVIDLDRSQLDQWRQRTTQTLPPAVVADAEAGTVILRHAGIVQGGGLLRQDQDGRWNLESHFPKAWAIESKPTQT